MNLFLWVSLCIVLYGVYSAPTPDPSSQPTSEPSTQPTRQPSRQPSSQPSVQPSKQPVARPSGQPTGSPTSSPSSFPTSQPSSHPLAKPTSQPSRDPTSQPSCQPSRQPSSHPTTPTSQPSSQPSVQPSTQPSSRPSRAPSAQPSHAPSRQPTSKPSRQPTSLPSAQPSCLPSNQPSAQPFSRPTSQPSVQPSIHPSSQPSVQPSSKPSTQPSSVPSTQPSTQPSSEPTNPTTQPSCQPSVQPSRQPSSQPSTQPSSQPTVQPSTQPSSLPSSQPSSTPTTQPSVEPSIQPTVQPSRQPTGRPSRQPSAQPTERPSTQPSARPSCQPTSTPTVQPSSQPTLQPTRQPSDQPTAQPSRAPTAQPSHAPSRQPTSRPSRQPTAQPSTQPSRLPSSQPSVQPSMQPTSRPSRQPSMQPSSAPTRQPTAQPSGQPSTFPSGQPSRSPTSQPSAQPTMQPSSQPSSAPSLQPAAVPTSVPSTQPSNQPSSQPTSPTSRPTMQPSTQPTAVPTLQPSASPTSLPSPLPPCPPGSFYNLTGHTVGYPPSDYYECHFCPAGQYNGDPKKPICEITPRGYYSPQNSTDKIICPRNTYAETNGTAQCTDCPSGEVIGITGSFSSKDCMDPAINFIMGSVAFILAVFAIFVYMWFGRLHRIAFQRKFRLIRKLIMMYGTVLTTADMITRAGTMLTAIQGIRVDKNTFRERIFKPFIFFFLVFFVIIPGITALYVFQSSLRIIFNAMVLFRAYQQVYMELSELNFTADFLHPFLNLLEGVFPSRWVIYVASYPVVYILDNVSTFSINLSAVKVTCPGAQSPLYLLTDMIIVAVVILVIESDVHVFWTMMITPAVSKIRSMVFSAQYFRRFFCSTLGYLSLAMLITQLPDPAKLVQYSMSFVVMSGFFNMKGEGYGGWINASKSCDGAVGIPIDSILANLSAIFAIIVLPAVIYLISVVLFALKDDRPRSSGVLSRLSLRHSPSKHASAPPATAELPGSPATPSSPAQLSPVGAAVPSTSEPTAASQWCTVDCCRPWCTTTTDSEAPTGPQIQMEAPDAGPSSPTSQHAAFSPGTQTSASAGPLSPSSTPGKSPNKAKRNISRKAADVSSSDSDSDYGVNVTDVIDVESPHKNHNPRFSMSFDEDWNAPSRPASRSSDGRSSPTPQSTARNSPIPRGPRPLSPESATSAYSHRSFGTPSTKRQGLKSLHVKESEEEENHTVSAALSKFLRAASSFFALDWLFFTGVYHLGHYVFKSQQDFLTSKYMVHTAYRRERFDVNSGSNKVQVYVDAFEYDKNLKELRKYAASAQLRPPPLYDGFVGTDSAETIADRKREDDEWEQEKKTLPSYFEMTMEVNNEMKTFEWQEKYMPYSRHFLCHWMPMQWCTKAGRKSWLRVFQTYFGMFLLCLGIWPEWLVEDFKIVERFKEFHRLNEMIYSQIGRKMFTSKVEDAFTKIENDEKVSFGNFVAAITTCRIALLQIMPALTVWSLFASAVASTPLFVSSKTMDDLLPPLLALNTYKTASEWLEEDYGRAPSRFQTAFLSYYLFIHQSRIIQFVINGFLNAVSIVLIFNRERLKFMIAPMAFVMLHQGLLSSVYVTLLFKKLLFPVVTEETRAGGDARTAAELAQMEAPDPHADDDNHVSLHDIALMENTVTESPDGPDTPLGRFSPRRDTSLRMQDLQSIKRRGSTDSRHNLNSSSMQSMGSMRSMSVENTPAPVMPTKGSLWRRSSALDATEWSLPTSVSDTNLAATASARNSPTPDTSLAAGQMKAFPI